MLSTYEAEENYYYYKNKCEYALQDRQRAKRDIANSKADKLNFNKRIQELENIIQMLEGNNPFTSVSFHIDKANKTSMATNDSFQECIKCNGSACADFHSMFKSKSVTEDVNSNNALTKFKNEKKRLENEVQNLDRKISNLETEIDNLTHSINCYCYEIDYNKKFMY